MSLVSSVLEAVRSWRRRRAGTKAPKRADIALERLDHRQLLSVNFTGNPTIDFPVTTQPGVVVLQERPDLPVTRPLIPGPLQPFIPVSGFEITGIRLSYTPNDDTLSIGLDQPPSNPADPLSLPVIAGDADDNGNSGENPPNLPPSVSQELHNAAPNFSDFQNLGGTETLAAFLNFVPGQANRADLVAGFSNNTQGSAKTYQVADALVNPSVRIPAFGDARPQNTGGFFLFNNPLTPGFEFSIRNFSQVYTEKTGLPFTPDSVISVGAFGGSNEGNISEAFFPPQPVSIRDISPPPTPPPPPCPPLNPPVIFNIHENRHVNTAHDEVVRAYVFGTSGFQVQNILPFTVRVGGAAPIGVVVRDVNNDGFKDETFFFRGDQIKGLAPGFTQATITGTLVHGTTFSSAGNIFNRDASFYTPAQLAAQRKRAALADQLATERATAGAEARAAAKAQPRGPVVSIPRRGGARARAATVAIPGVSDAARAKTAVTAY